MKRMKSKNHVTGISFAMLEAAEVAKVALSFNGSPVAAGYHGARLWLNGVGAGYVDEPALVAKLTVV